MQNLAYGKWAQGGPINCAAHSRGAINSSYAAHREPDKSVSRPVKAGLPRGRKPREKPPSNGTSVHSIPIVLLRNDKIACGCVAALRWASVKSKGCTSASSSSPGLVASLRGGGDRMLEESRWNSLLFFDNNRHKGE